MVVLRKYYGNGFIMDERKQMKFFSLKDILVFATISSLSLLIGLIFTGCFHFRTGDELTKFHRFEFSSQDPSHSKYFTISFSQSNTIYLKKYSRLNTDTIFYSILPLSERSRINSFLKTADLMPVDSLNDMNSGEEMFAYYLDFGNETHSFTMHRLHPPLTFVKFNSWINKIIDSLDFKIIDTTIEFKDDEIIHTGMKKNRNKYVAGYMPQE